MSAMPDPIPTPRPAPSGPPAPDPDGWEAPRAAAPIPFDAFRAELLALYQPPMRAKGTLAHLKFVLDRLAELLGPGATTAGLTPALVARFVSTSPDTLSTHTLKTRLNNFRTACSYAQKMGYIRVSPFVIRKNWMRVGPPKAKQHHSRADIQRVLDLLAAEVRDSTGWGRWRARRLQALAATVAFTGMRREEALRLHVEDVDLAGGMLALVERDSRLKTVASSQPVPIPAALAPILESWLSRRMDEPEGGFDCPPACDWLFPNVTRTNRWKDGVAGTRPLDQLKAAGERAGVQGFTFLSLRHSFATHAEHWGLGPGMVARILRHTTVRTQQTYRHADEDNLRAAVKGIEFGPAPEGPAGGPTP